MKYKYNNTNDMLKVRTDREQVL